MTKTATDFHAELSSAAAKSSQEVRRHSGAMNEVSHQGDCYGHKIKSVPPAWNVAVTEHRQVAVGEGIGSHHIAEGPALKVLWPKSKAEAVAQCPIKGFVEALAEFCLGPVVVAEKPWTLTHPKHAHHDFPAGVYLITYQLDRATMRQVRD